MKKSAFIALSIANVIFYESAHGKFNYAFWRKQIIIYERGGKVFSFKIAM